MAPEIRRLADAFLRNPKEIAVSRPASVATTIVAGLAVVDDLDKREALRRLIRSEDVQNALIFCNRKRDVDILYKSLKRHGFSVGSLHGDMSQPERFATLNKFKAGELRCSSAATWPRAGIDIGGLSHVFNFDVPIHAEDYVHRIGRTGRAGLTGHAYTLATPHDRGFVEAIEKLVGTPDPAHPGRRLRPGRVRRGRRQEAPRPQPDRVQAGQAEGEGARPSRTRPPIAIPVPKKPRRSRLPRPDRNAACPAGCAAAGRDRDPARARAERAPGDRPRERTSGTASRPGRSAARRRPRNDDRDRARDRYRRDDDLGPPVLGFGDEVPAFMLLRAAARSCTRRPKRSKKHPPPVSLSPGEGGVRARAAQGERAMNVVTPVQRPEDAEARPPRTSPPRPASSARSSGTTRSCSRTS